MRSAAIVVGGLGLLVCAACGATAGGSGTGGNGTGGSSATANGGMGGGIGGGIGGGNGGLSSGGAGGSGGGPICQSEPHTGQLVPLDMYVMLDRSGSMDSNGGWTGVTTAFKNFVALPGLDGLGMGISFFPIPSGPPPPLYCDANGWCGPNATCLAGFNICVPDDKCEATDYAQPVVPIAPLPGVGPAINNAMNATKPAGNTPTRPALQGAMMYALNWAQAHPDHVTVVVLATDGEPTGCTQNEVPDVSAVAAQGLASNPSVRTFVVGIGNLPSLDAVAKAGGTQNAIIVSTSNPAQDFLDALNAIRGAIGCSYKIPVPNEGGQADPELVNVVFTPEGGGPADEQTFGGVDDPADCQGKKAWHYNADKTQIVLCPAACDLVTNQAGTVEVQLGCETVKPT
jgi:hypothetical protein